MGLVQQVGIDTAGGGGGGVAQGLPDVEEIGPLSGGHGGECVAQAVQGDLGQSVLLDEASESQTDSVGGAGAPRLSSTTMPSPSQSLPSRRQSSCCRCCSLTSSRYISSDRYRVRVDALVLVSFCMILAPAAVRASRMNTTLCWRSTLGHRRPQISSRRSPSPAASFTISSSQVPSARAHSRRSSSGP